MIDQAKFNKMSAVLTGFEESIIAPGVDPIGLPTLFFQTAQADSPVVFNDLLSTFVSLKSQGLSDNQTGNVIMGLEPDPATSQDIPEDQTKMAQAILKLWYLGSWYPPFSSNPEADQTVVSDQSYIKGLAWQAMQSHAMGHSTFTFGYWDSPPKASLQATTGNPNVGDQPTTPSGGWEASS